METVDQMELTLFHAKPGIYTFSNSNTLIATLSIYAVM